MKTNNEYSDLDGLNDLDEFQVDETNKAAHDNNIDNNNSSNNSNLREFFSYIKIIIIAVGIAFICNNYIIVNAKVPSNSMNNTIMNNNRLIGFRLSYLLSEPKRFDVVIFKFPDDESTLFIKRIIGLPGDVVEIKNGHVYVNGDQLNEPYIKEPMITNQELTYCVPEDHYFMLGDNRNDSKDSRAWEHTFVAKDKILAKAIFKYYDSHPTFQFLK